VHEASFFEILGVFVAASAVLLLLTRKLFVPNIVAYIVTGLLLGPITGLVSLDEGAPAAYSIDVAAHVGIVLLLFLVGLELSFDKLRDIGKVALYAGLGQVIFTAAGGFGLALLLDFDVMSSVFLATALTFSSTVVVVKLLDQKKEISSLYGRIAIGIFLVQDLVVIIALTFLSGLGKPGDVDLEAADAALDAADVALSVAKAFGGMAGLLVVALVASRWLLPVPFAWAARSSEALFAWSLSWCFLVVLAAEWLGLSPEIGAFLAGMSLAQLGCAHELLRRVQPLMNFFIAVFFVALGARMELAAAIEGWQASVVLSLFVLIGNPLIFIIIIVGSGYDRRTAFLTSVTVAQISEFSFIFAAMGVSSGLIEPAVLSVTAFVGLVTIGVSSYMILYNHQLYAAFERWGVLRIFKERRGDPPEDLGAHTPIEGHVVVVGMNALGRQVALRLHERGVPVIAIDKDPGCLADLPCRTVQGDPDHLAILDEAFARDARAVIAVGHDEETNQLLAWCCRRLEVPVAIQTGDAAQTYVARELGVDFVIDTKALGVHHLDEALERLGVIPCAPPPWDEDVDDEDDASDEGAAGPEAVPS